MTRTSMIPNPSIPKVKAPASSNGMSTAYKNLDLELPSDRLIFALKALNWFEKQPQCKVDMNTFHSIETRIDDLTGMQKHTCIACMAGAAAIKRYNEPGLLEAIRKAGGSNNSDSENDIYRFISITGQPHETIMMFEHGINLVRLGYIVDYVSYFYQSCCPRTAIFKVEVADYHTNPKQFKCDMQAIVRYLQSLGL